MPKAETPESITPTTPPASPTPPFVDVTDRPLGDTFAFATTDTVPKAGVAG